MVAATFSWPVATPAALVAKVMLAQELSQVVLRPRVGVFRIYIGLTSLAGWELSTIPARRCCHNRFTTVDAKRVLHAAKVAAAAALTPSGTSGTA
jgi:hypothetical protein